MRSLIKETFGAAYALSPIVILCIVPAMALLKREKADTPDERKEIITNYRTRNETVSALLASAFYS